MLNNKYSFKESEAHWQKFWEENHIYDFDFEKGEVFSIDTPPPTVSGSLHIGHIFSYTQAEIIARFQRMQGKNVFYPCCFDDNGLPTERLVEKTEGITAKDFERSDFIRKCLEVTKIYEQDFRSLWKTMGFSMDWSLQYETVNPMVQRISQKSFIELAKADKAYNLEKPVLWCTNCQTSIAQAELESADRESQFIYIPFTCGEEELIVATTRPELLYGCVCLFIHPEDTRYSDFLGREASVPIYGCKVPILADDRVDTAKGSGIVMCATFGDTTDVEWYNSKNLPFKKVIEEDGRICAHVPFLGGMKLLQARKHITALLEEKNLIRKKEPVIHPVLTHERCGTDVEFIISRQWYIKLLDSKEDFLKAGEEINWYPQQMKSRYENWVKNLKWDWCISRQRYFGVPFPLWYCKNCGKAIYAREEDLPVNPLESYPDGSCSCGCKEFIPEYSVMDTWATSSLTPLINGRWREEGDRTSKLLPMSLRTQAHEIIRTWAFYTIVKSLYHTGSIPWKNIMISGFVMADKGEKISKSKNNSKFTPSELIQKYSADGLRYWAADARLGTDTIFSEEQLKISNRFLTKFWNAGKFSLMHLKNYDNHKPEKLLPIDRWILEKSGETMKEAVNLLNNNEIGLARHLMDDFFWKDYCDNYLEIVKDRLYKPEVHGHEANYSGQYAVFHGFYRLLQMYSIYVPHITEEIYQSYFRNYMGCKSIHLAKWSEYSTDENSISISGFGEEIKDLLNEIRKFKTERNLSLKEPLEKVCLYTEREEYKEYYRDIIKDLYACTSAREIKIECAEKFGVEII